MSVELEHYLTERLRRLSRDDPERPFLEGILRTTRGFVETRAIAVAEIPDNPITRDLESFPIMDRVKKALRDQGINTIDQVLALLDISTSLDGIGPHYSEQIVRGVRRYGAQVSADRSLSIKERIAARRTIEDIERFRGAVAGVVTPAIRKRLVLDLHITTGTRLIGLTYQELEGIGMKGLETRQLLSISENLRVSGQ